MIGDNEIAIGDRRTFGGLAMTMVRPRRHGDS